MDGNKDEALKCLTIGKQALESGDRVRALKFVTKACRLDPSLAVDDLLSAINQDSADRSVPPSSGVTDEATSSSSSSKPSGQSNLRHRVSSNGPSSSSASDSVMYTEEQILIVRQIKKKKDYYEILGLERTCSVEDVKKAYRKLSLKVHPDKNKAPGAEEAFKAVSKAFQCLSGEESRKKYDLVGSDEPVYERRQTQGFNGFYDADIDADEIFRNFFFGGGMPPSTQFRGFSFNTNMGQRRGDNGSGGSNLRALIQLLPVLLILLLNFLPSSDPVYMLYRSYPYEYKIMTQKDVPFYVKSTKFEQDYPTNSPGRLSLEGRIEREYFSILSQNCRLERQRRQWGLAHETPHCDMLQQFENVA